jgi:hypothetical protein
VISARALLNGSASRRQRQAEFLYRLKESAINENVFPSCGIGRLGLRIACNGLNERSQGLDAILHKPFSRNRGHARYSIGHFGH